jgi:TATA-binding protein-associated factor
MNQFFFPFQSSAEDPLDFPSKLTERRKKDREFIDQLLNPKNMQKYHIVTPIKAELRSYQIDGINWLGFLNKYNLHGILCDGKFFFSIMASRLS